MFLVIDDVLVLIRRFNVYRAVKLLHHDQKLGSQAFLMEDVNISVHDLHYFSNFELSHYISSVHLIYSILFPLYSEFFLYCYCKRPYGIVKPLFSARIFSGHVTLISTPFTNSSSSLLYNMLLVSRLHIDGEDSPGKYTGNLDFHVN